MSNSRINAETLVETFISALVNKGTIQRPENKLMDEVTSILEVWLDNMLSTENVKGYTVGLIEGKKIGLTEAMTACCDTSKTSQECIKLIETMRDNVTLLESGIHAGSIH